MLHLETKRLSLRRLRAEDAAFILELQSDPDWLRYIGDRGVHSLDEARAYIVNGPISSYARHGFGLYMVELKPEKTPLGICGLLRREALEDVDLGFAFLPAFRGRGYASEAAAAVLEQASGSFGLSRVVAITTPDNHASIRVLERLGFHPEGRIRLAPTEPELLLFATGAPP